MEEGSVLDLKQEVQPYVDILLPVCANEWERKELIDLVFTLYMDVLRREEFFQFLHSFHSLCTSFEDVRKLCRMGIKFLEVWQGQKVMNMMTTFVRSRVMSFDDETVGMQPNVDTLMRLELMIDFLCDSRVVTWFQEIQGVGKNVSSEFLIQADKFATFMDWVHDTVSVEPAILRILVDLWKSQGKDACEKFVRVYKQHVHDGISSKVVGCAARLFQCGHHDVGMDFLRCAGKCSPGTLNDLYQTVETLVFMGRVDDARRLLSDSEVQ